MASALLTMVLLPESTTPVKQWGVYFLLLGESAGSDDSMTSRNCRVRHLNGPGEERTLLIKASSEFLHRRINILDRTGLIDISEPDHRWLNTDMPPGSLHEAGAVLRRASKVGISTTTLTRARWALGIVSEKDRGRFAPWLWSRDEIEGAAV